ncbi:bifunctional RNA recognition motif domain/Nucleotide-binding alpha-beta plait domain superfamily/TatSF1-like [Babesia duncani]|uniref:Bifunctional RNA recognition motif domain/Nucleotide-binding alpha-beta plait domain superfamily/TatSF1-like n=1 Tax=Babesia duncani TaxID=323732 RepID=A0AAD9PLP3_9APIC|nr:bifunctional RNA recognition motif domain/Nucleotide-binding alpha-beta plait domain superfamily/TatSF1-like [Babesia duncani]
MSLGDPVEKWYIQYGENDVRGPVGTTGIKELIDSSAIDGFTHVWCDGMDTWKPISQLEQLRELLIDDIDLLKQPPPNSADSQQPCTNPEDQERKRKREKKKLYLQRKKQRISQGQWIDSAKNTSVYVSNLPLDTSLDEVASVFKKAGVFKIDPVTTLPKIKLYTDEQGNLKGDARVTFVNKESVDFAIRYLDQYHFRPNVLIHVEQAQYEPQKHKGGNRVIDKQEARRRYLAAKYEQERLSSWGQDVDDGTGKRIVICKPMFSIKEANEYEADAPFYQTLRNEVMDMVSKLVPVEKVTPIARHPQGIVCIKFKSGPEAEVFISNYKGRTFREHQLDCFFYNGKTDLQAQALPSKVGPLEAHKQLKDPFDCQWIQEQSSDEEFEIRTAP